MALIELMQVPKVTLIIGAFNGSERAFLCQHFTCNNFEVILLIQFFQGI